MTKTPAMLRAAFAGATLTLLFTLPVLADEPPKSSTPATQAPTERDSHDAAAKERADCKKIYRLVHRGAPGKGTEVRKLVRVECPVERG